MTALGEWWQARRVARRAMDDQLARVDAELGSFLDMADRECAAGVAAETRGIAWRRRHRRW